MNTSTIHIFRITLHFLCRCSLPRKACILDLCAISISGAYRYNLHLLPKSLLIEAGAQTNTVEEMMNAMEVLSDILYSVIMGRIMIEIFRDW